MIPSHLLQAHLHHGGCLLGAFSGTQLVGLIYGFAGPAQSNYLLSHLAAVHPSWQGQGLGQRLKMAQAEWARQRGFQRILWTFDPMQPANARLNIAKLGAVCRHYREDYYGPLDDDLNRGIPTDRLEVEWWLSPIQRRPQTFIAFPRCITGQARLEWRLRLRNEFQQAFADGLWVVNFEIVGDEARYWMGEVLAD